MKIRDVASSLTLVQCINVIVQKYTSPGDVISLTSERKGFDFPTERIVYNSKVESLLNLCDSAPKLYIFDEVNIEEVLNQLVEYRSFFNPRSRYVFIGTDFIYSQMEITIRRNIFNAVFVERSSGLIYTLFPSNHSGFNHYRMKNVGQCQKDMTLPKNLFSFKLFDNWKKPKISILYYHTFVYSDCLICRKPGIEIEIFQLILRYLDVEATFSPSNDLLEDQFKLNYTHDIEIGTRLMHAGLWFEQSVTYLTDNIKFFVPTSQKIPKWRLILSVFSLEAWCAFILTLIILTSIWFLFDIAVQETNLIMAFLNAEYFFLVFFVGRSKQRREPWRYQELLYFNIILLSFTMYLFFNTRLTFLLYGTIFEKGIENSQDIVSNGLLIGSPSNLMKNLLYTIPGLENYPERYHRSCNNLTSCLDNIRNVKNLALFFSYRQFRNLTRNVFISGDGSLLLRELDQSYYTAFAVAYFQKGHPMLPLFNRYLTYLIESGIIANIVDSYSAPLMEDVQWESTQKLNFQHMMAPFYVLAVGNCLGCMVWLLEVKLNI
ncbi:hypothetical protein WA026_008628 [Henosepilachna vigintioctopunctata]|uniref:Ionotropic receptor n=1 Tax=Henosepilachna vigintioctopunctata TaxID=420089 RepID=A0AAW1UJ19_9CUCU